MRTADDIRNDLTTLPPSYRARVDRVFLADGNALSMQTDDLLDILAVLYEELPSLRRVGVYAYARDVDDKNTDDLRNLKQAGLGIVYLGLETGDDELLRWVRKGVTVSETIDACRKIRNAGIPLSLTIILGLGGNEHSVRHARATAEALNAIDPEYVGALTLMIPVGTPIYAMVQKGEFIPMKPIEILKELRILVNGLNLTNCIFRTNHASNYLPLGGTLNRDKKAILRVLDDAIDRGDRSHLRPEALRGL